MDRFRITWAIAAILMLVASAWYLATDGEVPASRETTGSKLDAARAPYQRPENIPYPASNRYSEAKYHLGKNLFFDPRLSRSGSMACATCHNPSLSWTDGLGKAVGDGHKVLGRKAPTLLNAAWGNIFFWDGRAATLEEQALGPIQAPGEMNMPLPQLIARLNGIREYAPLFEAAFPGEPISARNVGRAIATFERTIVSDIAPFDRWIEGDETAISPRAKRGFVLFNGKATCVTCHNGWNFTNGSFADIGLPSEDLGRGKILGDADANHSFKTPTLRNAARRAPYTHDGSLRTLRDVIENYDVGGTVKRETTKLFLKPLNLTDTEKEDLIAFLETLTSEDEAVAMPSLPRGEWEETSWERSLSSRSR